MRCGVMAASEGSIGTKTRGVGDSDVNPASWPMLASDLSNPLMTKELHSPAIDVTGGASRRAERYGQLDGARAVWPSASPRNRQIDSRTRM